MHMLAVCEQDLINQPPPLFASVLAAGGCWAAGGRGAFGDPVPAIQSCCIGDVHKTCAFYLEAHKQVLKRHKKT